MARKRKRQTATRTTRTTTSVNEKELTYALASMRRIDLPEYSALTRAVNALDAHDGGARGRYRINIVRRVAQAAPGVSSLPGIGSERFRHLRKLIDEVRSRAKEGHKFDKSLLPAGTTGCAFYLSPGGGNDIEISCDKAGRYYATGMTRTYVLTANDKDVDAMFDMLVAGETGVQEAIANFAGWSFMDNPYGQHVREVVYRRHKKATSTGAETNSSGAETSTSTSTGAETDSNGAETSMPASVYARYENDTLTLSIFCDDEGDGLIYFECKRKDGITARERCYDPDELFFSRVISNGLLTHEEIGDAARWTFADNYFGSKIRMGMDKIRLLKEDRERQRAAAPAVEQQAGKEATAAAGDGFSDLDRWACVHASCIVPGEVPVTLRIWYVDGLEQYVIHLDDGHFECAGDAWLGRALDNMAGLGILPAKTVTSTDGWTFRDSDRGHRIKGLLHERKTQKEEREARCDDKNVVATCANPNGPRMHVLCVDGLYVVKACNEYAGANLAHGASDPGVAFKNAVLRGGLLYDGVLTSMDGWTFTDSDEGRCIRDEVQRWVNEWRGMTEERRQSARRICARLYAASKKTNEEKASMGIDGRGIACGLADERIVATYATDSGKHVNVWCMDNGKYTISPFARYKHLNPLDSCVYVMNALLRAVKQGVLPAEALTDLKLENWAFADDDNGRHVKSQLQDLAQSRLRNKEKEEREKKAPADANIDENGVDKRIIATYQSAIGRWAHVWCVDGKYIVTRSDKYESLDSVNFAYSNHSVSSAFDFAIQQGVLPHEAITSLERWEFRAPGLEALIRERERIWLKKQKEEEEKEQEQKSSGKKDAPMDKASRLALRGVVAVYENPLADSDVCIELHNGNYIFHCQCQPSGSILTATGASDLGNAYRNAVEEGVMPYEKEPMNVDHWSFVDSDSGRLARTWVEAIVQSKRKAREDKRKQATAGKEAQAQQPASEEEASAGASTASISTAVNSLPVIVKCDHLLLVKTDWKVYVMHDMRRALYWVMSKNGVETVYTSDADMTSAIKQHLALGHLPEAFRDMGAWTLCRTRDEAIALREALAAPCEACAVYFYPGASPVDGPDVEIACEGDGAYTLTVYRTGTGTGVRREKANVLRAASIEQLLERALGNVMPSMVLCDMEGWRMTAGEHGAAAVSAVMSILNGNDRQRERRMSAWLAAQEERAEFGGNPPAAAGEHCVRAEARAWHVVKGRRSSR